MYWLGVVPHTTLCLVISWKRGNTTCRGCFKLGEPGSFAAPQDSRPLHEYVQHPPPSRRRRPLNLAVCCRRFFEKGRGLDLSGNRECHGLPCRHRGLPLAGRRAAKTFARQRDPPLPGGATRSAAVFRRDCSSLEPSTGYQR